MMQSNESRGEKFRNLHPNYTKFWYLMNKEEISLKNKNWVSKNKEKLRKYHNLRNKDVRIEVLEHYSCGDLKCGCCGERNVEFLTLEHVNGGGNKHRKQIHYPIFWWLKRNNYPKDYKVLCYNCNCSIGHYGYCPHQKCD